MSDTPLLSQQLAGLGLFETPADTRRQAHAKASERKAEVYGRILKELERGPGGADAIADRIGEHFMYVRPRISELLKANRIRATGRSVPSSLGNPQAEVEAI